MTILLKSHPESRPDSLVRRLLTLQSFSDGATPSEDQERMMTGTIYQFLFFLTQIPYLLCTMINVAVGIIRENGNVLICQRKKSARYGLKWEFPGGKLEENESPIDGLKRELEEELAIDAAVGELYYRQQCTYPDSLSFEIFYYLIPSYRGTMRNRMFEQIQWIPEEKLAAVDMLEGNRNVVEMILKGGKKRDQLR